LVTFLMLGTDESLWRIQTFENSMTPSV